MRGGGETAAPHTGRGLRLALDLKGIRASNRDAMKRFFGPILPVCAAALLVGGCGSPITVHTDYDEQANFAALKTWAWSSKRTLTPGNPEGRNTLIEGRLDAAIERELAARGFRRVSSGSADFVVNYSGAVERRLRTQVIDRYYGYPSYGWYGHPFGNIAPMQSDVIVTEYERGSLVLDIAERRSKKLVWRGTAMATLLEDPSPQQSSARIDEAVRKLLAGFPPAGR